VSSCCLTKKRYTDIVLEDGFEMTGKGKGSSSLDTSQLNK